MPEDADTPNAANYSVRGEIARGGMGSILEAEDRKLQRTVAMKVMLLDADAGEEEKDRFVREATVLAKLANPNIVPIYDMGRDAEGRWFYTMKLVKGRTLLSILAALRDGDSEVRVNIDKSKVTDAAILADFPDLEEIYISPTATNVERLRPLKKLRYLSLLWNSDAKRPAQTAKEFWKEHDAAKAKKAGGKQ